MTTQPTTTPRRTERRPPRGARQVGYLLGAVIDVALIWVINVSPGWRWVGFLSEDFAGVVGLVNLSLVVGLALDLVYMAVDPVWLKRLGDALNAAFACVILGWLWAVFPFDLAARWSAWETPLRIALAVLCIATGIAVLANVGEVLRRALGDSASSHR